MTMADRRLSETCERCGGWVYHRTDACTCAKDRADDELRAAALAYVRAQVMPKWMDSYVGGCAADAFMAGAMWAGGKR
jgi:hypothetical protein